MGNFISFINGIVRDASFVDALKKSTPDSLVHVIPDDERVRRILWMPDAVSIFRFSSMELDVTLFLDRHQDVMMAALMTDRFYQSVSGDADQVFFVWTKPCCRHGENIILHDRKGSLQNIYCLYHVPSVSDLFSIGRAILADRDIPDCHLELSVEMASRCMVRRCREILASDVAYSDPAPASGKSSREHLIWMADVILGNDMPIDKMNRWLGYIQAMMSVGGAIDVDTERDYSRRLFHMAYRTENIRIPETLIRT